MKIYFILIVFLLFINIPSVNSQTSLKYSGPENGGFFPIGWSVDGTLFAYGWYETTIMISNAAELIIIVQNLVNDKIIWKTQYSWDVGNVGEGGNSYVPKNALAAWKEHSSEILDKLYVHNIDILSDNLKDLPFNTGNNDLIDVKIMPYNDTDEYTDKHKIIAYSDTKGEKVISVLTGYYDLDKLGYVCNPDKSRIAVVISTFITPFRTYIVIGCSTKSGFKFE